MPAKSKKQQRFMAAVANNPEFAKKVGVPKSVGEEFMNKSSRKRVKKYQEGGDLRIDTGGKILLGSDPSLTDTPVGTTKPFSAGSVGARRNVENAVRAGTAAMNDLNTATQAINGNVGPSTVPFFDTIGGGTGPQPTIGLKKGGKVKKPSKPKAKSKPMKSSKSKVRGVGKATRGVRAAKMVSMKGS